jgi:hypothetical protein
MKIALCLCGIVGTDSKYGIGDKKINYKVAHKHFKDHLFDLDQEVDVFFHSWSTEYEDRLNKIYNPVSCEFEDQPFFSENPRTQATYCRWLSTKKSIDLMRKSNNSYDFVLLTRFDIAFLVDFDFKKYDNQKFYAQGPVGPFNNGLYLINDLWFFSSEENMIKLSSLYDCLEKPEYKKHIPFAGHELVRKHLLETDLDKKIEYIFKREWTGASGKLSSDTPLIRWYYMNKV